MRSLPTWFLVLCLLVPLARAERPARAEVRPADREALRGLDALYPELDKLYQELHRHPELSNQERQTAARLAARLKALGFTVTTGVGKLGVVGVLKNGAGPTVMLRTEMDGLPVEEKTGLAYASKVKGKDPSGRTVPVMHACGHDVHMAAWIGAAALLARSKPRWRGTVVMVAQPAEELVEGARAMLADGLFERFPRPEFAVAVHVSHRLPAGTVGYVTGPALANVDSIDLRVF